MLLRVCLARILLLLLFKWITWRCRTVLICTVERLLELVVLQFDALLVLRLDRVVVVVEVPGIGVDKVVRDRIKIELQVATRPVFEAGVGRHRFHI